MGLLEDRLAQTMNKGKKDDAKAGGSSGGGSPLGSIMKGKIKSQQQTVDDDNKK